MATIKKTDGGIEYLFGLLKEKAKTVTRAAFWKIPHKKNVKFLQRCTNVFFGVQNDILNSDDAFESDQVIVDMANGKDVSQREYRLAKIVSSLYKIIHPAFGCAHHDWDNTHQNYGKENL